MIHAVRHAERVLTFTALLLFTFELICVVQTYVHLAAIAIEKKHFSYFGFFRLIKTKTGINANRGTFDPHKNPEPIATKLGVNDDVGSTTTVQNFLTIRSDRLTY